MDGYFKGTIYFGAFRFRVETPNLGVSTNPSPRLGTDYKSAPAGFVMSTV